jgi:hypothetical protein
VQWRNPKSKIQNQPGPWGQVCGVTVPTFGFTGELQDGTTGLVYLRAR